MDTLVVDPTIQDVLGRNIGHVGLDNTDCFDIDLLDQYLQNEKTCLPEDTISAIAYNNRPIQSFSNHQPHISQVISHTSSPPQVPTTNYGHMRNHAILNGQNHCYDNPAMHPTLPDSPPDSEPYSPPDGHHNPIVTSQENKYSVNPTMHHMYPPSHHRPPGIHTKTIAQGYNEPPVLNHMPPAVASHPDPSVSTPIPLTASGMNPQMISPSHSISSRPAKRKYPDSPSSSLTNVLMNGRHDMLPIKQEPSSSFGGYLGDCDEEFQYDPDSSNPGFMDSSYQVIKWTQFNIQKWTVMTDSNLKDLPPPHYRIDSDKGFNFSTSDEAFVCQKKNHFQVTAHMSIAGDPKYVRTSEGVKKIDAFYLHFYGVKVESQSQMIKIEQSQSDRSKKPFYPVRVELIPNQTNKMTVGRLHFSETTSNNMRKKGRPNPDQRYFMLVVGLHAHCGDNDYMVAAQSSERLIVRASNPGQFDNDVDIMWQKAQTPDGVYHVGRVGVNTDHPEEALTVHGNMRLTGHLLQPSDQRVKTEITAVNSKEQLKNVAKLNMYKYKYKEDFADTVGLPEHQREDTGVIAQEVKTVLPDAVMATGDVALNSGKKVNNLLVVNKDRIFMENVGAVKELCKLTDNLEVRIDELEKMNKKLSKLKRYDSLKSTVSSKSSCSVSTVGSTPPKKPSSSPSHKYRQPPHQHSNRKTVSPTANGWCSNKFIQIVIITLILIMAFCLVAITVLYILERHTESTDTTSSPLSNGLSRPEATATKHPVTSRLNGTTVTSTRPITHSTTSQKTPKPTSTTRGFPLIQFGENCNPQTCEKHCCPPPNEDDEGGLPYDPSIIHYRPFHLPGGNQQIDNNNTEMNETSETGHKETNELPGEGDKETNELPGEDKTTTKDPLDNNLPTVPTVFINNSDGAGPGYNYNDVGNPNTNVIQNTYLDRKKRQTDSLEADIIVGFGHGNVTLGLQFCDIQIPHPCRDRNNTYMIHFSQYWDLNRLFTVDFRLGADMGVEMCANFTHSGCDKLEFNGLEQTAPYQWKLPVTHFYYSKYAFRVARKGTPGLCSLGADSLVDFSEYTVQFVRHCPINSGSD